MVNSEDSDKMHNAGFHQDLHLLRQKRSSEEELQFYLEIITSDPLIYTMDDKGVPSPTQNARAYNLAPRFSLLLKLFPLLEILLVFLSSADFF